LLGRQGEAIEPGLFFKPVEFDGIKTGIVDVLPDAEELDGVAVAEPVADEVVAGGSVLVAGNVGKTEVILLIDSGQPHPARENLNLFRH
jgi:hypothetical protein